MGHCLSDEGGDKGGETGDEEGSRERRLEERDSWRRRRLAGNWSNGGRSWQLLEELGWG